ncbi:hypothetical protein M3P21_17125 [Ruegeria sp. 2012CJ41-6]|uniref:Uncharacterized protein n=1 Tax=Ruegeria spongiae TaxID=2942209 RepID=A0ABT0Q7W2_9RHOB|nr:hypothetical protein [Ruegeria spongiae]MCL6285253.1 hypothetical protein [Ruegeria spongiae]
MNIDLSRMRGPEDKARLALDAARTTAHDRLHAILTGFTDDLTGAVPLAEQLSWSLKESAAQAVLDDAARPDQLQMLALEAEQTGEAVEELSARILGNARRYHMAASFIAGLRSKYRAVINKADTCPEIAAALRALQTDIAGYCAEP